MATSWEYPMCLIRSEDSGHLEIDEETAARLGEDIRPLVVVGIAGLYRTGKSYILNLLAGQTKGFCLGSTVQSCTKGIWVWLIDHPTKPGWSLLLMDTEGLGDVAKGDAKHDVWIFCLAVLLSSIMVYNSKGSINTDAISKLHFVTKMADNIQVKAKLSAAAAAGDEEEYDDSESLQNVCPVFIWAVRDFTLELKDRDGQPITSDEYLMNALKPLKGKTTAIRDQNACRESLRDFFSTHKCFTFPIPVSDSSRMKDLESLTEQDLAPGFQEAARELREYVYSQPQPKKANDIPVTGKLFVGLARQYVDALLKGAVPCIQNAVHSATEQANNSAIAESMKLYSEGMAERASFPTESQKALEDIHEAVRKKAVQTFTKASIFDGEGTYLKNLQKKLDAEYESYRSKNEEASDERCQRLLGDLSKQLCDNVESGIYMKAGGYRKYEDAWNTIKEQFWREPGKGLMARENWAKFEELTRGERRSILASDNNLTAKDKEIEEERSRADEIKRKMEEANREKERSLEVARKRDQERTDWEAYIAAWKVAIELGGKILATSVYLADLLDDQ